VTPFLPTAERWRQLAPSIMLTVTVLIWASNNIVTKLVLVEVSAPVLNVVRFTLMAVAFHVPCFLLFGRFGQRLSRTEWRRLAIAASIGYALSPLSFTIGLSMTTATYAALMLMTGPLWTAVLERVIVGTPIGPLQVLGMAIAFGSAVYLGTGGSLEGAGLSMLIGGALMMAAQTTWGVYTLMTKPILSHRQPLIVFSASNLAAFPFVWLVTGSVGDLSGLGGMQSWSTGTWLAIFYLVVGAGITSQVLYLYGLRDVSPSQAMAFTYLMPVFTAVFAAAFLDEHITAVTVVCGALIVFGLWLVNRARQRPAPSRDARPASKETLANDSPSA
jgi:drug/metabolite transporter (DMT)-like permease